MNTEGFKSAMKGHKALAVMGFLVIASLAASRGDVRIIDAAKQDNTDAVRALLRQRVDVNARHADGSTALVWATYHENLEMVELLVAARADVNTANEYGETPLSLACQD